MQLLLLLLLLLHYIQQASFKAKTCPPAQLIGPYLPMYVEVFMSTSL